MTEAFNLLDVQPDSWPRWQPGEAVNGVRTHDRHLFLFLETVRLDGEQSFGGCRPACFFVGGATPVFYDNRLKKQDSEYLDHCNDCQEVQLQHALARL